MQDLYISETDKTPEVKVNFTEGIFEIKGISIPENALKFFQPLMDISTKYLQSKPIGETEIIFKLAYVNTSTSGLIGRFIKLFEPHESANHITKIKWYYDEEDEDMKEMGADFQGFTKISLEIISVQGIL